MRWLTIFERYPLRTMVAINVIFIVALGAVLELGLRYYTPYNIRYYTATKGSDTISYPYGEIPINSLGYVDEEFNLATSKPRVGYVGDSVIFGLGAGYPYRISEVMQNQMPSMEHWNVSLGIGAHMDEEEIVERARDLHLDLVVYVMNLNDIAPTLRQVEERDIDERTIWWFKIVERDYLSWLRGKSYLYNVARTSIKNLLQRFGYQESGSAALEFWPSDNADMLKKFASRVIEMKDRLGSMKAQLCVIIVPYEMQISREAENIYSEMGFAWEDGFERGLTQHRLAYYLPGIEVYDARQAFDKEKVRTGEYFVYNRGDKIDWNHLTRKGHEKIAMAFIQSGACGFLSEPTKMTLGRMSAPSHAR